MNSLRTPEDVEQTLGKAKIKSSGLNHCTQVLKFSEEEKDFKCLELHKDLQEFLELGQSLVIRGDKNNSAVLCTHDKTYDLKEAETSNSLLILKGGLQFPKDFKRPLEFETERYVVDLTVEKMVHSYLEPRLCRPRLDILRHLLSKRVFKGPEKESDYTADLFSFEKLLGIVQASEEEIVNELHDLHAVEYKGFWRILDFEYLFRIFSLITIYVEKASVPIDHINLEACFAAHENFSPREIFEKIFKYYTEPLTDEPGFYSLRKEKVCKMVAESLLKAARKFNLEEFLPVWQESVIPGLKTDLDQLKGIVIVEKSSNPPAIWYFPERELPMDINERLQKLFQERLTWPLDDIVPYMLKLSTPQLPVNALLAKYARMSSKNGVKYITGRHSK